MIQITGILEVILYVQNMDRMVQFYRDTLGLEVVYPQNVLSYTNENWVTFQAGAYTLALHSGGRSLQVKHSPKIVFGVIDIEHARSFLSQREVSIGEIRLISPGVLVCDAVDPEGNSFSLEYQELITDVPSQPIPQIP